MSSGLLARSMLEEMLSALKTRDEKPKDVPPALPARPTLKRRLPSSKMPARFRGEGTEAEPESKEKASETSVVSETDTPKMEESIISEEMDVLQPLEEKPSNKDSPDQRLEEFEKLYPNISDELKHKEEENAALLQQLQQFEKQSVLCHEQMKCMEDMYLQQIETLKTNLASAQMTLAAIEAAANQQAKREAQNAAQAQSKPRFSFADHCNNPVQHLTKEFEKQKQVFEDDARAIDEAKPSDKPGQSVTSSMEELRELKVRYNGWKKEYEVRLGHAKKSLVKLLKAECEKHHEKWWFNRRKRSNKTASQPNKVGFCYCIKNKHDDC